MVWKIYSQNISRIYRESISNDAASEFTCVLIIIRLSKQIKSDVGHHKMGDVKNEKQETRYF